MIITDFWTITCGNFTSRGRCSTEKTSGEKEKWDIDVEKITKEAEEAIKKFTEELKKLENEE